MPSLASDAIPRRSDGYGLSVSNEINTSKSIAHLLDQDRRSRGKTMAKEKFERTKPHANIGTI
ncbi:hypothetical protein, partial [Maricaulis sp.]|uniref:hypothetical protein n=1 Tax=Maricaulis sp. TaxID=1486257 RepID=UPI00260CA262